MICIKNLNKSFKQQRVLTDVSMTFPDKGLYFILGQSGCGKSTLLNCLSGLLDFSGKITINGDDISLLSPDDLSTYRLKNIGFVYQDFKLFDNDNVFDNVALPLKCLIHRDDKYCTRRVEDILDLVAMRDREFDKVSNLSGGEKQRIAIARAIINEPKVLLCDEPTGALDSANKALIMSILKTISSNILVIVVTHDEEIYKKYGNGYYCLRDGKVEHQLIRNVKDDKTSLPIYKIDKKSNKNKVPFRFLYSHTKNSIKSRKFRSLITNLMISFGLLGTGLAFSLTDTIYNSILASYSNIIADNQVIVSLKGDQHTSNQVVGASLEESNNILKDNNDTFTSLGAVYYADFENYFKDLNELVIVSGDYKYKISGYSARTINEFVDLQTCDKAIFPKPIEELRNDEIIISITPKILREICYYFRIPKTVDSLSDYLLKNKVLLCFNFANNDWQYHDQQIVTFKGFVLDSNPMIFHSNNLWNEYVFENMMRFPINYNFSQIENKPWILKKCYYLKANKNLEEFIAKSHENNSLCDYVFEVANKKFYPNTYSTTKDELRHRILVFKNNFSMFMPQDWKYMKSLQKSVKNPIFSTKSGYSVYGTSLLSGFNNMMFFAKDDDLLNYTTGIYSSHNYDPLIDIELPDGVLQGHYSKTSNNGVFFKGIEGSKIVGKAPENINQIVISSGMAKRLFNDENSIGKIIKTALTFDTFLQGQNKHKLTYQNADFLISGIVEDDRNILYGNDYWSIDVFQLKFNVSIFDLLPIGMSMEIDNKKSSQNIIKLMEKQFPQYDFSNPLFEVEKQVKTLCNYMRIILLCLSVVTLLIAICLITFCNFLHILEIKKDLGLIRCLGVKEKDSRKLLFFHSLFIACLGAITTIFEMLLIQAMVNLGMDNFLGISLTNIISPIPYIIVMGLSVIIGLVPAYFVSRKLIKLDPIECLKA